MTFQERLWQRLKQLAPNTWKGGSGYCRDRAPQPLYVPEEVIGEEVARVRAWERFSPTHARGDSHLPSECWTAGWDAAAEFFKRPS